MNCVQCGNKTRFDVVTIRKTREFHHFTLGGESSIAETEIIDEEVQSITCRWCGAEVPSESAVSV